MLKLVLTVLLVAATSALPQFQPLTPAQQAVLAQHQAIAAARVPAPVVPGQEAHAAAVAAVLAQQRALNPAIRTPAEVAHEQAELAVIAQEAELARFHF